jgi:chloramphenicol O-acetyltransferase
MADNQINAFIHPYQQFASTLFETVDRNPHLDIVTKASFVQQFLTRLRNRCTEVETLTSGPGVVFSMKDFNDCIQTMCRGMVKYCETTVRSMNETSSLRIQQLQHHAYTNERQKEYYKRKCETFVNEIDKIINAKMTEKGKVLLLINVGAAIIYELDITHRELRMLKDNYYLMETMMREEILKQFIDEVTEKNFLIKKYREAFAEYKTRVNKDISSEVYNEITTIESRVMARANVYKMTDIENIEDKLKRLQNAEKQKGLPIFKAMERVVKLDKDDVGLSEYHNNDENDQGEDYGAYEPYMPSAREEILQLHRALRNQKNFMRMKEIMMKEKHEREIFNLKQQLTSNQCLWEQLAESEKREAIMRQELFFTQQSLATCEKIISKMQSQLEVLQNQRLRLQQYKNNKTKRLDELEGKVRQMEILENIDLNKLLDELRLRDRKLSQLTGIEKNLQGKMDAVYKVIYIKIYSFRLVSKKLKRCDTNSYKRRR